MNKTLLSQILTVLLFSDVGRTFLNDLGGNPNKKNGSNESVLHSACTLGAHKTFSAQERRAACVTLLLQWRGVELNKGDQREKVDLSAQDNVSFCFILH